MNTVINPDASTYEPPRQPAVSPIYPLWMYHPTLPPVIVNNAAQQNALIALNTGWTSSYLPPYNPPTIPPFLLPNFLGSFVSFAELVAAFPLGKIPAGSNPVGYTLDAGLALWNGSTWIIVSAAAAVMISSPDGSLLVSGSPGTMISMSVASSLAGAANVLAGLFTSSSLPSAAANKFVYASTSDLGGVFSNGVIWQQLYNQTSATIAVSTGTPLTPASTGVPYSVQLSATAGTLPYTWSLVSTFGSANSYSLSSSGLLTVTTASPGTDSLSIQVVDATGADAQKVLTLTSIGSLSPAATPTFSPVGGVYSSTQTVTITCSTGSSTIHYTTDGTTPTTSSTTYSTPLSVSATSTLQAIAVASGHAQSAVGSAAYTISSASSPAATPTFAPVGGAYSSAQSVAISCTTPASTIHYTTDGSTPTTGSTVYSAPITVSSTSTIQAIATAAGFSQSGVGSAAYTITLSPAATPTFSPVAGTYTGTQAVSIACSTSGATIYYTTNGSAPTTSSTVYSGPLTVSVSQTVKAIATASGFTQSAAGSAAYVISTQTPSLKVKFRPGIYMQSGSPNDQASMNALATSWAGNGGVLQGYSAWYKWSALETALGVYNFTSVFSDYTFLQSKAPGASFVPQFNWYANQTLAPSGLPSFNPVNDGVPSYILNAPATYGSGPPTSSTSYGGWLCDGYFSPNYNYVRAAYWRAAVQARIEALFQAFGSTIVPDGQGFTVDQHPLFEMVGTSTPTDLGLQTAPNIASDYSYQAANQAWVNMLPSLRNTMPHTGVFLMPGFGANNFGGGNDPTQQNVLIKAMLANGIAQSCTDCYLPAEFTYAQNYAIGSNFNGTTGFQASLLGQLDQVPSVQGDDYPLATITQILNTAFVSLRASRLFLYSQSSANFNVPGFWNTIIGTINAYSIPSNCSQLPTMYMFGVPISSVGVNSSSSLTVNWAALTGVGTGMTVTVYRNGSVIATGQSGTSFVDTGLTTGTTYSYTLAMSNANATGPQGTAVTGTTL